MADNSPTLKELEYFYENFKIELPFIVLIKIIFSLGLYLIWWIYKMNQKLEEVDESAPETRRGLVILYLFPPMILIISLILEYLIKLPKSFVVIFDVLFWSLAIFLSLKYIYDFCTSFGKWTGSSGLAWYLFIYPGYFSIILYVLDFFYALPLLFFTIIAIPGMQAFLNIKERKFRELLEHERFNRRAPAQGGR